MAVKWTHPSRRPVDHSAGATTFAPNLARTRSVVGQPNRVTLTVLVSEVIERAVMHRHGRNQPASGRAHKRSNF